MYNTDSPEAYIVNRYKLWKRWETRWDYKHLKGARIAQIMTDTGGIDAVAVEVGVGPGGVATAVSRHGLRVIGMDLSPDALVRAKEHCRSERVSLMLASGFAMPFADASFSLIYSSQVLHLFDASGRLALMREARRVLRPGGRFIFDMKNAWSHPFRYLRSSADRKRRNFPSSTELQDLLGRAGFEEVVTRPGLLPGLTWSRVPDIGVLRHLAHTTFYVARCR